MFIVKEIWDQTSIWVDIAIVIPVVNLWNKFFQFRIKFIVWSLQMICFCINLQDNCYAPIRRKLKEVNNSKNVQLVTKNPNAICSSNVLVLVLRDLDWPKAWGLGVENKLWKELVGQVYWIWGLVVFYTWTTDVKKHESFNASLACFRRLFVKSFRWRVTTNRQFGSPYSSPGWGSRPLRRLSPSTDRASNIIGSLHRKTWRKTKSVKKLKF